MTKLFPILLLVVVLAFSACTTTRVVKPLEKKQWAGGVDFGGPIIDFADLKIPLPLSSVSAAYGLKEDLSLFTGIQLTDLAFGVVHWDMGANYQLLENKKFMPGITTSAAGHFMVDTWEGSFRFYPQLDLNFYWHYKKNNNNYLYFSLLNWFDFASVKAHGEKHTNHYVPSFALGHTFVTPQKKMRYTVELKWIAPFSDNRGRIAAYNGLGNQGALGAYISILRTF